ncbi:unnamed protein product [Staurois parvus]|uniref:Uncharacterized protein n=1 Tax=Staurois parvus TaxID=386267 RepID=A0ABN9BJ62_9NEOB|nr:unnamed protein product [Staurois parvus]
MVRVTKPGINTGEVSQRSGSGRVGNKSGREKQEQECRLQDTGAHGKTHTKAQTAGSGHSLNTPPAIAPGDG